jgi:hypothetical protein
MLTGSVHLSLLMGPAVAVPVPKPVTEALERVEITTAAGERGGFSLTFTFSSDSPLTTLLLLLGQIGPVIRTVLFATVNGIPIPLVDGVVTHHQISPDVQAGKSTLVLTGEDLTAVMDQIDMTGLPYPGLPPFARVNVILAKYAVFGIIPLVVPNIAIDVPIPTNRIPTHRGTDLAYVEQLAEETGYVFYVQAGPVPGASTAYWGPEIKVGVPQPALNVDMDAHSNVETINFRYDGQSATLPVVFIQNELTRAPIPIPIPPGVNPLNPPLGLIPPIPSRVELMNDTANKSPAEAIMLGLARAARTSEAVTATGSLDVLRYGRPLQARSLVGVRGAGTAYDGLYFVKRVTHKLERGAYLQDFTLTRNGLVSTVPKVPA